MVSMRPARLLRSATKAPRNSIANTAASSANLRCETFERFYLLVLRNLNRLVVSEASPSGSERTLEEVGQSFGVTRERIRQIEAKALRKLRHPSRSGKLKALFHEVGE